MIDKKIHNLQIKEIDITKYRSGDITKHVDFVAEESPLQIKCDSKAMSITMRTPGDDIALTLGFMFTEGLLKDFDEVADVVQEDDNTVNVMLEAGTKIEEQKFGKEFL
ncbi:MAG: formate dehydrogenase accessory sulfurtransferase FdhD [Saprospiraceae bacterium]|nr:formate dehydrogenase accessory sulfurtransferase FdhD [Saprospiraceae bacterium]